MKPILILSSFLVVMSFGFAQKVSPRAKSSDSLNAIPFINTIEQSLNLFLLGGSAPPIPPTLNRPGGLRV